MCGKKPPVNPEDDSPSRPTDESLHTLLNVVADNQALYMKHQWQVTYFTFLLYGAVIYLCKGTTLYWQGYVFVIWFLVFVSIFVICTLDDSISEHQGYADAIYVNLHLIETLTRKDKSKKCCIKHITKKACIKPITLVLTICIIVGAILITFYICDLKMNNSALKPSCLYSPCPYF